jgi:hypothetical protein
VSPVDFCGRTIWIADAHREDGKRFVVRSDEKLTAFMERERAIYDFALDLIGKPSPLLKIALVLMRLDHIARAVENANLSAM